MEKTVLVVEDEMLVAHDLAAILTNAGYSVVGPACNLADATSLASHAHFDAALLDLVLGGASVEPLATLLGTRGTPFAFVSGHGRAMLPPAYAAAPLISKPFAPDEIIRAVEMLLRP